jgi:hypothetical protein
MFAGTTARQALSPRLGESLVGTALGFPRTIRVRFVFAPAKSHAVRHLPSRAAHTTGEYRNLGI